MAKDHQHRQAAVEAYKSGMVSGEVCQKFDLPYDTLNRWLKADGVPRRGNRPRGFDKAHWNAQGGPKDGTETPFDEAQVVRQYQQGYSITDLARHHGLAFATMRKLLIAAGVELRSPQFRRPPLPKL